MGDLLSPASLVGRNLQAFNRESMAPLAWSNSKPSAETVALAGGATAEGATQGQSAKSQGPQVSPNVDAAAGVNAHGLRNSVIERVDGVIDAKAKELGINTEGMSRAEKVAKVIAKLGDGAAAFKQELSNALGPLAKSINLGIKGGLPPAQGEFAKFNPNSADKQVISEAYALLAHDQSHWAGATQLEDKLVAQTPPAQSVKG